MRYQQIHTQKWRDTKYRSLNDAEKVLFDYYQTSPNSNSLGVYQLSENWAMDDLDWDTKRGRNKFKRAKKTLISSNLVKFDPKMDLVCVVNQLKYNPLKNPNAVKSALKYLQLLPKSFIYQYLNIEPLTEQFHEPLRQQLRYSVAVTLPLPLQGNSTELDEKAKALEKELGLTGLKEEPEALEDLEDTKKDDEGLTDKKPF